MNDEPTYSENVTKRILSRAVELDHMRSQNYSLTELRNIAVEVGVSEAALEQAMRELQPVTTPAPIAPLRTRLLLPTAAAAAIGVISGVVDSASNVISSPLAMGVLLMVGGVLAVSEDYRDAGRGLLRFQFRNALAWAGFGIMWIVTARVLGAAGAGDIATLVLSRVMILGWGLSSLLGSLAAAVHVYLRRSTAHTDAGSGPDVRIPLKQRIADKLKSWIDIWASRISTDDITHDRGARAPLTR